MHVACKLHNSLSQNTCHVCIKVAPSSHSLTSVNWSAMVWNYEWMGVDHMFWILFHYDHNFDLIMIGSLWFASATGCHVSCHGGHTTATTELATNVHQCTDDQCSSQCIHSGSKVVYCTQDSKAQYGSQNKIMIITGQNMWLTSIHSQLHTTALRVNEWDEGATLMHVWQVFWLLWSLHATHGGHTRLRNQNLI